MDWSSWVILVSGVTQAVVAVLHWLGVKPPFMGTGNSQSSSARIMLILMLLTWAAVGYNLYDRSVRSSPQWSERPLIEVRDKTFRAQTVPLDGYEYINCDFNEVSFEFKGTAPSRLTNSRIHFDKAGSQIGITSQNPVVSHTLVIVDALNKAAGITNQEFKSE